MRREDLPPAWDPPPQAYFDDDPPDIDAVLDVLLEEPVPNWVGALFVPRFLHVRQGDVESSYSVLAWRLRDLDRVHALRMLELLTENIHALPYDQRVAVRTFAERLRDGEEQLSEEE